VDLDAVVLAQTLAVAEQRPGLNFSVNVSAASLMAGDLLPRIRSGLHAHRLAASRLHLEVTETALVDLTDPVREAMQAIAQLGVKWWVDDFGTGYSSISHLRDLPISGLKLDKSFTDGLGQADAHANRLAQGLVGLADGLGLETLAEGIESQHQADILMAQGWQLGQGWHYGKAAPL